MFVVRAFICLPADLGYLSLIKDDLWRLPSQGHVTSKGHDVLLGFPSALLGLAYALFLDLKVLSRCPRGGSITGGASCKVATGQRTSLVLVTFPQGVVAVVARVRGHFQGHIGPSVKVIIKVFIGQSLVIISPLCWVALFGPFA